MGFTPPPPPPFMRKTHTQHYRHLRHGIPRKGEKQYRYERGFPYFPDVEKLCLMPQIKPHTPTVN